MDYGKKSQIRMSEKPMLVLFHCLFVQNCLLCDGIHMFIVIIRGLEALGG